MVLWPVAAARCLAASRRRVLAGAIGVMVACAVVLSWLVPALRSTPPTYPSGDQALLEIYTLHASHGDLSVGPYSQKQWNHPGPAYFYALAPLHVLTGHEFSLRWTVLLLNLVSAVAAVVLVARYGGWPFGLGMMTALSIYFLRPSPGPFLGFGSLLSSAWNPHAPMLPLAVLLVLCARLGSGNISSLPWIVLVASFVTQTHIEPWFPAPPPLPRRPHFCTLLGAGSLADTRQSRERTRRDNPPRSGYTPRSGPSRCCGTFPPSNRSRPVPVGISRISSAIFWPIRLSKRRRWRRRSLH